MTDYRAIVEKMTTAWNDKNETLLRSLLHDDYKGTCPAMEINSPDECVEFMKNCPFEGSCENHEIIVEGNKVVNAFDWVVTAPFQATIPMVEIMNFEGDKLKNSKMYYDTSLIPAEFAEAA